MVARSTLKATLDAGRFLLSAELTPPRNWDLSAMLKHAATVKDYVDVVQLNDQLLAQARCSTLVAAAKVQELGLEPVLQFSLRHKNRIAIQSDLLGIAALGLKNVIVLHGYPIKIGSDPEALDASDLPLVEALHAISRLASAGILIQRRRAARTSPALRRHHRDPMHEGRRHPGEPR
jgi:methylenetetrahydrofolate reductase (NADPH)